MSRGNPAFEPTGVIAAPRKALVIKDVVVHLRAKAVCRFEAHPHLNPFHGLDAHQGHSEPAGEATIPLSITTQPKRRVRDHDFKDPPQGVALMLGLPDPGDHFLGCGFIRAPHVRLFRTLKGFCHGEVLREGDRDAADRDRIAVDVHPEFGQQPFGHGADSDADGRLAGARLFQHVPDIPVVVFDGTDKIGVPRTRTGHHFFRRGGTGLR